MSIRRRDVLAWGGSAASLSAVGCATRDAGRDPMPSREAERTSAPPRDDGSGSVVQRTDTASVVRQYDAQGEHRTATAGDSASATWLLELARRAGATAGLEPFALQRVDPLACHATIEGRRVDGVPLFDAAFTDARGITGRIGPLGSDAEIGLAESEPSRLAEPGPSRRRAVLADVRASRHRAVVLVTRGSRPGLSLLNAPAFLEPSGPPTLQVSSAEAEWLGAAARSRATMTVVVQAQRTDAQGANVTAMIAGTDLTQRPLVVSTPRSGWWRCAAERGGGLACWVEVMRTLAQQSPSPRRTCLFVAFSGHEIGWLGMRDYLSRRAELPRVAHLWLHFGANIGAARQPNMVNASDDALEQWAASAMAGERLPLDARAPRGSTPFGEAAFVHRAGGRYVALVCDNERFHSPDDRWPDAVDVSALNGYARAFAKAIAREAQTSDPPAKP